MSARTTHKFRLKVDGKVVHIGVTNDLKRREREHRRRWPTGQIEQVGRRTTREEAWNWPTPGSWKDDPQPARVSVRLPQDLHRPVRQWHPMLPRPSRATPRNRPGARLQVHLRPVGTADLPGSHRGQHQELERRLRYSARTHGTPHRADRARHLVVSSIILGVISLALVVADTLRRRGDDADRRYHLPKASPAVRLPSHPMIRTNSENEGVQTLRPSWVEFDSR